MAFLKARIVSEITVLLGVLAFASCTRQAQPGLTLESHPRAVLTGQEVTGGRDPSLAISSSGMLSLLAVYDDSAGTHLGFSMSHDGGDTFMPLVPVSEPGEEVSSHGENSPRLATTPTATYALWEQRAGKGANELAVARSLDFGHSFQKPVIVTGTESADFHGFSTLGVAPNGDIYVVWLDGREPAAPAGTFSLYYARSTDRGASFSPPRRIALAACPCCRPAIAFGPKGAVFVAWRKVFPKNVRDMVLSVSRDAGQTFAPETRIADDGWSLNGCPDSGPSLAVQGERLYVAWLTEGREQKPRVQLAWSENGGGSFHAPMAASPDVLDPNHPILRTSEDGHLWLAFQGRNAKARQGWEKSAIFLAEVDRDHVSKPEVLPNDGLSVAYPALCTGTAGRIFAAWTARDEQKGGIQLLRGRSSH